VKKLLKSLAGRGLHHSGLHRRALRETGVIVAFHRVDDRVAGDALSVGVDAFDRFCQFFRRHYDVISLGDLVTRLERGVDVAGSLAITFDDGYLDNYENAAPILRRLDLPATFFVTSDFIETETVAWWDAEISPPPPWMNWKQVRALADWGFEIGGHTRTHANLGEISGDAATKEIAGGRSILEKKLDRDVDLFAYPYGRVDAMAEENRDFVREAAFRCCVSCHGGLVTNRSDPFRLHRVPINGWFADPYQFGLEVVLSRA
jgi:peptidoglycan/xylan/chitin deacetylase (PgdA/CDA1 family)